MDEIVYMDEKLDKNMLITIALLLDLPDIINFCDLSGKHYRAVCDNVDFWRQRLKNEPDYLFEVNVGFYYDGEGRGYGTFVISLSRYIPNRDVIRLIQNIVGSYIDEIGSNVNIYSITNVPPGGLDCRTPVLDNTCFQNFNRKTQQVDIRVFLNEDIDEVVLNLDMYYMNMRKRLNIIHNEEIKKYTESLRGTNKEYLIGLARLEPPQPSIKKQKF